MYSVITLLVCKCFLKAPPLYPSYSLLSYLYHLGVPEGAREHGAQSLGGLVDGDAAEERLVLHVAVGEAGEAVGVQHLHRPVEQAVLRRRPALPWLL